MNILIQGNIFNCSGSHGHTALPQLFTLLTTWACQKLWEHNPKTLNHWGQPHLLGFRPKEGTSTSQQLREKLLSMPSSQTKATTRLREWPAPSCNTNPDDILNLALPSRQQVKRRRAD